LKKEEKTKIMEPIRYLSWEEMEQIHKSALYILSKIGMRVDHIKALEYLKNTGCNVDMDCRIVKFPEAVVERAVSKMKANFSSPGRLPKRMAVRYSRVFFENFAFKIHEDFSVSSGGFCCFIYDLDGNRRYADRKDVKECIRLAHKLDQITYTGLPVAAQDVTGEIFKF
jgi:trimethylamine--corrinoid protein Co-methyltransferase